MLFSQRFATQPSFGLKMYALQERLREAESKGVDGVRIRNKRTLREFIITKIVVRPSISKNKSDLKDLYILNGKIPVDQKDKYNPYFYESFKDDYLILALSDVQPECEIIY